MAKFKFTDKAITTHIKNDSGGKFYDTHTPGLSLVVTPTSQKWRFHKRVNGKLYQRTLGDRLLLSLAEARKEASKLFTSLSAGVDPKETQRAQKQAGLITQITLAEALESMLKVSNVRPRTATSYQHAIKPSGAFYNYRDQPLISITPEIVIREHKAKSKQSPSQADKDARTLRAVWKWAQEEYGIQEPAPTDILKSKRSGDQKWNKPTRRKTAILRHQLKSWFDCVRAIQNSPNSLHSKAAYALELILLTGLRRQEILGLKGSDVNVIDHTITITGDRSKNHQELIRPLSQRAFEIVTLLNRHGYLFEGAKRGMPIYSCLSAQKIIKEQTGMWTPPNDLRRTFLSAAPAANVEPFIYKSLVNHATSGDVTSGYQVVDLDVQLDAAQAIEDYLLTQAGMLDQSLDIKLGELIKSMTDDEKRRLIFQLSEYKRKILANG